MHSMSQGLVLFPVVVQVDGSQPNLLRIRSSPLVERACLRQDLGSPGPILWGIRESPGLRARERPFLSVCNWFLLTPGHSWRCLWGCHLV